MNLSNSFSNGNANDDIVQNPQFKGILKSNELSELLQTWVADEPALNLNEKCVSEEIVTEECLPLPPESDPCLQLLDDKIFGQCHLIVDALKYVSMCQADMCKAGNGQIGACSHISAYARECSRNGICVDWKKGACSERMECPIDMEYKACGCHKTCAAIKDKKNPFDQKCTEPIDGCFCRDGKYLTENGKCIPQKECLPCDDKNHFIGDKWHPDKCSECECNNNGKTICTQKQCSNVQTVCQLGYKQVTVDDSECCPVFKCVPEVVDSKCIEKPLPKCSPDQYTKAIVDANNCTLYVCECKPLDQCKPSEHRLLRAGEKFVDEKIGCCPKQKVVCDLSLCPPKPSHCDQEYYEIVRKELPTNDYCCEEFECVPPKNLCIVKHNDKIDVKKIDDRWPKYNEPCWKHKCVYDYNGLPTIVDEREICPVTECALGFKLFIPNDKCCGECVQDKCVIDNKTYDIGAMWFTDDNCTSFKCAQLGNQLVVTTSQPTCPDTSDCPIDQKYFEDCCERCKPIAEDISEWKKIPSYLANKNSQYFAFFSICRNMSSNLTKRRTNDWIG